MSHKLNRVQPQLNPDGTRKTYEQRRAERRAADFERQAEAQRQKQQAKIDGQPPQAPRLSAAERVAHRKAEDTGRAIAQEKAAAEQAANAGPVNPYRARAAELQLKLYKGGDVPRRHARMLELADQWDQRQEQARLAAERQALIDNDPATIRAIAYVDGLRKLSGDEWQEEIALISGLAAEGQAALAFERIRALEERQWAAADAKAAAALQAKTATDAEFTAAAEAAAAARDRLAAVDQLAEPEPEPAPAAE